jgi:hypothetical protein
MGIIVFYNIVRRKQACKLKIALYSDFVIKSLLRYYYYHAIIHSIDDNSYK